MNEANTNEQLSVDFLREAIELRPMAKAHYSMTQEQAYDTCICKECAGKMEHANMMAQVYRAYDVRDRGYRCMMKDEDDDLLCGNFAAYGLNF